MIYTKSGFTLWDNLWITGFPEFASPGSDFYYPLIIPLLNITQDIYAQINYSTILHLIVAFITTYLLLGLITEKKNLKMAFSLLYIFSALMLSRVYVGHEIIVFSLAWIPLLYYSFAKIIYKSEYTVTNVLIFSLTSALFFFTGVVYLFALSFILMGIFALYFIITKKTDIKAIIILAISTVIFLLLTAIKSIPMISISDKLLRVDGTVDPLGGGGSLESNLASFIFGTPINKGYAYTGLQYGIQESTVLIGAVSVFLIIIALVYGKRIITIPSFCAILFALIYADGGKVILSFIHLLPILSSFRCPGRVFCSLMPLLIFLSLYGLIIVCQKLKENNSFKLDTEQKKSLLYGTLILIVLKVIELPYEEIPTLEAVVAIVMVFGFIALLYSEKITKDTLIYIFSAALLINIIFIIIDFTITPLVIAKTAVVAIVVLALIIYGIKDKLTDKKSRIVPVLVGVNIIICCMAGLTFIVPSNPELDTSAAIDVIDEFQNLPTDNIQKWAYTSGWAYQNMDYTYHFMNNGIHSMSAYWAYYLDTMLPVFYTIGDKQYSTADYIVDTQYASSGELSITNYTTMVKGVPITVPENILPNVFILRSEELIPVEIEEFTPDEVIATGDFETGDIAVLKTAYYDGWKVNGEAAASVGNMVGAEIKSDTGKVTFKFQPASFTTGLILSIIGVISIILLIVFRKKFENFVAVPEKKKNKK
ncbi:hypothetical protein [Methanolacinia petrolearia]|nr:hypothetical protein [Methanolacinia petrolearia]